MAKTHTHTHSLQLATNRKVTAASHQSKEEAAVSYSSLAIKPQRLKTKNIFQ